MPWYNGDFPPSYKNQPKILRNKAVEIANELLKQGVKEGIAIASGLKKARIYFANQKPVTVVKSKTKKILIKLYDEYRDFEIKKKQYSKAVHIFHDHTVDYNQIIDELPVKDMKSHQKVFNRQQHYFHDDMVAFERSLENYTDLYHKMEVDLKDPVSFSWKDRKITMQISNGELKVMEE